MVQSGSHVQLKLKKEKIRENQNFFLPILGNYGSGRERVRGERKVLPSLYDLRRSGGRNSSSQDLKFIYSTGGRKNSMYGSFKGASRTQFRGFHAAAQLHCLCKASNFGRP